MGLGIRHNGIENVAGQPERISRRLSAWASRHIPILLGGRQAVKSNREIPDFKLTHYPRPGPCCPLAREVLEYLFWLIGVVLMSQTVEFDLKHVVLANDTFGPREVRQMQEAVGRDFSQYAILRDAVGELQNREDHTPASRVRLGVLCTSWAGTTGRSRS